MRGIAIRVGIVAVLLIGGWLIKDFVSASAGDLEVGQCIDLPSQDTEVVEKVQHHPCDQDHDAEVIFVGDYPGSKSDSYPTDDEFGAFLVAQCLPAFGSYTGKDYDSEPDLDISAMRPTSDGWKGGDQEVTCYIYRIDGAKMKGSLKAS